MADDTSHGADAEEPTDSDADESADEVTTISTGRNFEQEYRLDAAEAGAFLVDLGEQLQHGDELTIADGEWELPFAFGEPVHLEIDYDGMGEPELEIELELPGRTDEQAPEVN